MSFIDPYALWVTRALLAVFTYLTGLGRRSLFHLCFLGFFVGEAASVRDAINEASSYSLILSALFAIGVGWSYPQLRGLINRSRPSDLLDPTLPIWTFVAEGYAVIVLVSFVSGLALLQLPDLSDLGGWSFLLIMWLAVDSEPGSTRTLPGDIRRLALSLSLPQPKPVTP